MPGLRLPGQLSVVVVVVKGTGLQLLNRQEVRLNAAKGTSGVTASAF